MGEAAGTHGNDAARPTRYHRRAVHRPAESGTGGEPPAAATVVRDRDVVAELGGTPELAAEYHPVQRVAKRNRGDACEVSRGDRRDCGPPCAPAVLAPEHARRVRRSRSDPGEMPGQ